MSNDHNSIEGRGSGQVVSVLAFYSNNPSSNPAEVHRFSDNIVFENNKSKQKEAHIFKNHNSMKIWRSKKKSVQDQITLRGRN